MIEEALSEVRTDLARLVGLMKARGHDRATAYFEIGRDLKMRISLYTGSVGCNGEDAFGLGAETRYPYRFIGGESYAGLIREAEAAIDGMSVSIALACENWFRIEAA